MSEITLEITDVLKTLIEKNHISEAELARQTDIPRATINRLVSGRTPDPRASTLNAIANYFDITVDQLLGNQPLPKESTKATATNNRYIPVIRIQEASNWEKLVELYSDQEYPDTIQSDETTEAGQFAIRVKGEAMCPQFQENTILIIDPFKEQQNRDFVIAHIQKNDETIFRQLIIDSKCRILRPINSMFPSIELGATDKIIGTIIQTRKSY
ncbi:MAG: peptidase S24-like domain protein [Rickettsiaceae bacterium]|nr:peptidase S24-like domain protein [Rickettsiaceae bacterium]